MPARVLAFCAVETSVPPGRRARAREAIARLARRWSFTSTTLGREGWEIHFAHTPGFVLDDSTDSVILGPLLPSAAWAMDRHLVLDILPDGIRTRTDYTGSVPVFHSSRDGWVVSNIEPATVDGSGATVEDLSTPNLFGLLLFSHFLWDETLYRHVFQQTPDSRFAFRSGSSTPQTEELRSLSSEKTRAGRPIESIAAELDALNRRLVVDALKPHAEIVLPLSGGYDSRMILAAAAEDPELRDKLKCFTYGPAMSIEVQAAKRLAKSYGVWWKHVELPCRFLERGHLEAIGEIFGGSLHFHGMYQLEFVEVLKPFLERPEEAVLTSGYMTGVPAGQHVSLMLDGGNANLFAMFSRFGQSRRWTPASLASDVAGLSPDMVAHLETQLRKAFDHIDGDDTQKSVVCDILTRQRNFISYYPRTLEWAIPHVAPHMNPEYANFFLSLEESALRDRKAIEEMFLRFHPRSAKVFSNSNGLRSLSSGLDASLFKVAEWMRAHGMRPLIPAAWRNQPLALDKHAVAHAGRDAFWPLTDDRLLASGLGGLLHGERVEAEIALALAGDVGAYDRLCRLQAVAWSLHSLVRED